MVWGAVAAIGGSLVGGLFNKKTNKSNAKAASALSASDKAYNDEVRSEDRAYYLSDRSDERSYLEGLTASDRAHAMAMLEDERRYFESTRDGDRAYAADILRDDRDYAAAITADDRAYADRLTASDREYSESRLSSDRAYMAERAETDRQQYMIDRDNMQHRTNFYADASAQSRGINFTKLRDDAVAAGFNPLTAMSMAHAYSTHRDYSVVGGPYSTALAGAVPGGTVPGSHSAGNSAAASGGGAGMGGGGIPPSGGVMASHVPAGGSFQSAGSGYQSHFSPAMSSGSFIADAVSRAVDTTFNRPEPPDKLADALRNAHELADYSNQVEGLKFNRDFGYSLTNVEPFRASATAGVPALASDRAALTPGPRPLESIEIGGKRFVPVQTPDGKFRNIEATIAKRLNISAFDTLTAGEEAEILGEIAEVQSAANNPSIRRTVYKSPPGRRTYLDVGVSLGSKFRDFIETGITGSYQFPSHSRAGNR